MTELQVKLRLDFLLERLNIFDKFNVYLDECIHVESPLGYSCFNIERLNNLLDIYDNIKDNRTVFNDFMEKLYVGGLQ